MTALRVLSLPAHGALELLLGIALMAAPFALGAGAATTVIGVLLGAVVVGLGVGAADDLPVSAHRAFDQAIVVALVAGSVALGLAGDATGSALCCAVAVAHLLLTATTRYSRVARG